MSRKTLAKDFKKILFGVKNIFYSTASEDQMFDSKISNLKLNKIQNNNYKNKFNKTCVNILQQKLRKKEVKEKFGNRILFSLFFSIVVILFYITT